MYELDVLIMRGMLKLYSDDLPGAIADLGVAAARLRTGLPSTYPGPCLSHLSDAYFRRGERTSQRRGPRPSTLRCCWRWRRRL